MKVYSLLAVLLLTLLTGCLSPRVDWNARIGHYTFDQAVVELGPPDKTARLSDNRLVAEWITHTSSGASVSYGMGYYRYPWGPTMVQTVGPTYYERHFRLTFSPENVLQSWSRN